MRADVHSTAPRVDRDAREAHTSVPPAFQVAAVASLAGLCDSRGNVPLDRCILVRTTDEVPTGLAPRIERVLLRVNGVLSLGEIATATDLSLAGVIALYLELLGMGLVAAEPVSGTFRRITLSWEDER